MRTLLCCALLLLALTLSAQARTWTAKTGDTIDGEFVKLEGENVLIQLPDGSMVQIKLDLLSDADQKFVNEVVNPFKPVNNPFVVVTSPEVRKTFSYNTPRNVLEQEAQKDNPEALYYLARCYRNGWNGFPKDKQKSDEFFQRGSRLADTGNPFAQCCRAMCYLDGIGVPEDETEAVKWFRKAAEQGNAVGQARLGACYVDGTGVPEDEVEGVKWFRKAAEQGYMRAEYSLGMCYAQGVGVAQNYEEAAKWYRKAAEQGHAGAQCNLGLCYEFGTGVAEDKEKAAQWYRKAAEQGHAEAQCSLGVCYENGTGVAQDEAEAVKWYRKAAEQGHARAEFTLGSCYYLGRGVAQDYKEAVKWYRKAAEQGDAQAQYSLGKCYREGTGVLQDEGKAAEWLRKAARQKHEGAIEILRQLERVPTPPPTPAPPLQGGDINVNPSREKPEVNIHEADQKAGERMTLTINDVEYAFRWCPAGTFMMGSPEGERWRKSNETQHQVTLSRGFWMLETEVTQGIWESVTGNNPSEVKGIKLPVENVSWHDCQAYIKKLNDLGVAPAGFKFSLPTEAQWEYACRAGTTTAYHFGNTLTKEQANFAYFGSPNQLVEVGRYPANAWGLRDMHGNVWEWCQDWYDDYPSGAVTDPTGASTGSRRVQRGGGIAADDHCRSASRSHAPLLSKIGGWGFRLALVSESKVEDGPPTYRDKEYGFSFTYPEDWSFNPPDDLQGMYMGMYVLTDDGYVPTLYIQLHPMNQAMLQQTKEYVQKELEEVGWKNVQFLEYGTKQLSGKECLFMHLQMASGEEALEWAVEKFLFLFHHKGKTFQVMFMDHQANFGKSRPIFESIIRSFQFDEQTLQTPKETRQ